MATIIQEVFSRPETYNYTYNWKTGKWEGGRVYEAGESSTQGDAGSEGATGDRPTNLQISGSGQIMVGPNGVEVFNLKKTINKGKIPITQTSQTDAEQAKSPMEQAMSQIGQGMSQMISQIAKGLCQKNGQFAQGMAQMNNRLVQEMGQMSGEIAQGMSDFSK